MNYKVIAQCIELAIETYESEMKSARAQRIKDNYLELITDAKLQLAKVKAKIK